MAIVGGEVITALGWRTGAPVMGTEGSPTRGTSGLWLLWCDDDDGGAALSGQAATRTPARTRGVRGVQGRWGGRTGWGWEGGCKAPHGQRSVGLTAAQGRMDEQRGEAEGSAAGTPTDINDGSCLGSPRHATTGSDGVGPPMYGRSGGGEPSSDPAACMVTSVAHRVWTPRTAAGQGNGHLGLGSCAVSIAPGDQRPFHRHGHPSLIVGQG